jgi:hypothetical protein
MSTLLLKLLLLPPDLLRSHVKGYADLATEVGARYLCTLKNRWLMYGVSVLALLLALIFGGTGLLLWSVFPLLDAPHPWVLLALPAGFGLVSVMCWWWAGSLRQQPLFKDIHTQIQLDMLAIGQADAR